jgi:hypothetical protein
MARVLPRHCGDRAASPSNLPDSDGVKIAAGLKPLAMTLLRERAVGLVDEKIFVKGPER